LSIICTINHLIGFRRLLYIYVQFVSFSTCAYIHAHTINSGFLCSVKLLIMLSIVPLQCMLYCLHSTSLGCSVTLAQNSSTNSLQDAVYLLWPAFLCGMPQQPSDKQGVPWVQIPRIFLYTKWRYTIEQPHFLFMCFIVAGTQCIHFICWCTQGNRPVVGEN